jgi:hypothetical protein
VGTLVIANDSAIIGMLTAIDLDYELCMWAEEVDYVWADRLLTPKGNTFHLVTTQNVPEFPFGLGGGTPQHAGTGGEGSFTPLPNPPPQGGRGLLVRLHHLHQFQPLPFFSSISATKRLKR